MFCEAEKFARGRLHLMMIRGFLPRNRAKIGAKSQETCLFGTTQETAPITSHSVFNKTPHERV